MNSEPEPLAYSVKDAMRLISTSRKGFYAAVNSGRLKARKSGKRTIVMASDLQAYLAALPAYEPRKSAA